MSPTPETLEELLRFIHDDVKDIKSTLNGIDGLVAKVKVLEEGRESMRHHLNMVWTAFVALTAAILKIWFK